MYYKSRQESGCDYSEPFRKILQNIDCLALKGLFVIS